MDQKKYLEFTNGLGDHDGLYDMQGVMRLRALERNPWNEWEKKVLAIEAGRTLLVDRDEVVALADQNGIAIVAAESGEE